MSSPLVVVESKPIHTPLLDDDGVFQVVVPVDAIVPLVVILQFDDMLHCGVQTPTAV